MNWWRTCRGGKKCLCIRSLVTPLAVCIGNRRGQVEKIWHFSFSYCQNLLDKLSDSMKGGGWFGIRDSRSGVADAAHDPKLPDDSHEKYIDMHAIEMCRWSISNFKRRMAECRCIESDIFSFLKEDWWESLNFMGINQVRWSDYNVSIFRKASPVYCSETVCFSCPWRILHRLLAPWSNTLWRRRHCACTGHT